MFWDFPDFHWRERARKTQCPRMGDKIPRFVGSVLWGAPHLVEWMLGGPPWWEASSHKPWSMVWGGGPPHEGAPRGWPGQAWGTPMELPPTFGGLLCGREAPLWSLITHKYRGLIVAFLISKSVEPNEELKVELIFSQVLSTTDTTLRTLMLALSRNKIIKLVYVNKKMALQDNKELVVVSSRAFWRTMRKDCP